MASTTLTCSKDTRTALRISDSWKAGAGKSDYLPVGLYSGYRYRSYLGFSGFSASWTSITSATLHIKTSSQYYVAFASDPDVEVRRVTGSWSEGTSVSLSSSNATVYGDVSVTSTNMATFDVAPTNNTWDTCNITALMQDALAAGAFYGIELRTVNEDGTDVTEFYAREYGSNDAYISVTYTITQPPDAPTVVSPTASAYLNDTTPDITYQHNDPDADSTDYVQVQVSTDSAFGTTVFDSGSTANVTADGANFTITCTTALTRGTQYYCRARASDATDGYGSWSAATAFKVAQIPTVTLTQPAAEGDLAKLSFTAGAGWNTPRINVGWTFNCPDGGTQSTYEVEIYNSANPESIGTSFYSSGAVASTATSVVAAADVTEGNYYAIRVRATCSHGEVSVYSPGASAYTNVRARWGTGVHRGNLGSTPTSFSVSTLNTTKPTNTDVVMEYGSASTAAATPDTGWLTTLAACTLNQYVYYRYWLLAWGTTPTSPSLDKLVVSYLATVLVPDKWTREDTTNAGGDTGTYVYGTQSLKMNGKAATHAVYQEITVVPDTDYIISGRIKSSGNSGAYLSLATAGTSGDLTATTAITATTDWDRYVATTWNSGSNTSVFVRCVVTGASGTYAWFDAIKVEASSVVTPWTPAFVGEAVTLDAGGLQVDASQGGIFRLRGSTGGTRDRVDLGTTGLVFGGDVIVSSPAAGQIKIDNVSGSADQALLIGDDSIIYDVDVADRIGIKGQSTAANGGIIFGSDKDTNIYRSAANTLKTDDSLVVGADLTVDGTMYVGSGGNQIYSIYVGHVSITPTADTITSTSISGLSLAGSGFEAWATSWSTSTGDYLNTSYSTTGIGASIQVTIGSPSSSGVTVYYLRGNTTSTGQSALIIGRA